MKWLKGIMHLKEKDNMLKAKDKRPFSRNILDQL